MTSAWQRLQIVRDPSRPKAPAVLEWILDEAFELHGDRQGNDDPAVVVRIGRIDDVRIVAVGQDATAGQRITPAGYRKAIRAIELASRLDLPIVTIVDTPGADPLPDSEADGVAAAIARTFEALLGSRSPTLALLWGEGGSGGALAMAVCDRVVAMENAVFSVIAPEGAAAILYRDASRAPELAERLRITADDLETFGLVDVLIKEERGVSPRQEIRNVVGSELSRLTTSRPGPRLRRRSRRWRSLPHNLRPTPD